MELVFKQPHNKPPFIGILFVNNIEAQRMNMESINDFPTANYEIVFEPKGRKIDITLKLIDSPKSYLYKDIDYDWEKFTKFLKATQLAPLFNFSHIMGNTDLGHEVIRSIVERRLWILKINRVSVFQEH